jgi:opacity protein-like surface antigen
MKTIVSAGLAGLSHPAPAVCLRRAYLAALVSLLASAATVSAQTQSWTDGLYVEVFGGLHGLADGDVKQGGITGKGSYGGGQIFGGAVGKKLTQNWSVETEFFYRSNDLDPVGSGPLAGSTKGDFASTNLMFNGVYTFTQQDGSGLWGKFTPFVGAGLGFLQETDMDTTIGGVTRQYSDTWIPAAQLLAGVSYKVNATWSVFAETRYHHAGEVKLKFSKDSTVLKANYNGFSGIVGVRYSF